MLYIRLISLLQDLNKVNRRLFNNSIIFLRDDEIIIKFTDPLFLIDKKDVANLFNVPKRTNLENYLAFQRNEINKYLDNSVYNTDEEKNTLILIFISLYSSSLRKHFCGTLCPNKDCTFWKELIDPIDETS